MIVRSFRFALMFFIFGGALACGAPFDSSSESGQDSEDTFRIEASVSVTVESALQTSIVGNIQIAPKIVVLLPGQTIIFTGVALNADGRPTDNVSLRWVIRDPTAGTITPNGLFAASSVIGLHSSAVEVTADSADGLISAVADVVILTEMEAENRVLDRLTAYPSAVTVGPLETVGVGVLAWDANSLLISDAKIAWRMANPAAGDIDSLGFFRASAEDGEYPDAIEITATQENSGGPTQRRVSISVTVKAKGEPRDLSAVVAIPQTMFLFSDQRVTLVARAFDEGGRSATGVSLRWEVLDTNAGSLVEQDQFVAGPGPGRYTNALLLTATQSTIQGTRRSQAIVSVNIEARPEHFAIVALNMTPGSIVLQPHQLLIFGVMGSDKDGKRVPVDGVLEMNDPGAGSIGPDGVFTAGHTPGIYPDAVHVTARSVPGDEDSELIHGSASITIVGPLASIEIRPSSLTILAGESVRIFVIGFDSSGVEIATIRVRWEVSDNIAGTIDATGVFTAGDRPGRFEDIIRVQVSDT